jgi:hypothetical protein
VPRSRIDLTVIGPTGDAVEDATVTVNHRGAGTATHWSDETAGSSSTGAITTTSEGRAERWLPPGKYEAVVDPPAVNPLGLTAYTEPFDVPLSAVNVMDSASDRAFDTRWGSDASARHYVQADGKHYWGLAANAALEYVSPAQMKWTCTSVGVGRTTAGGAEVGTYLGGTAGQVDVTRSGTSGRWYAGFVQGDAQPRYRVSMTATGPQVEWGDGVSAPDSNLRRTGATALRTDASLGIGANATYLLDVNNTVSDLARFKSTVSSDTHVRIESAAGFRSGLSCYVGGTGSGNWKARFGTGFGGAGAEVFMNQVGDYFQVVGAGWDGSAGGGFYRMAINPSSYTGGTLGSRSGGDTTSTDAANTTGGTFYITLHSQPANFTKRGSLHIYNARYDLDEVDDVGGVSPLQNISTIADNGSGNARITMSTALPGLANGNAVWIQGTTGSPSLNTIHTVSNVSGAAFDVPVAFGSQTGGTARRLIYHEGGAFTAYVTGNSLGGLGKPTEFSITANVNKQGRNSGNSVVAYENNLYDSYDDARARAVYGAGSYWCNYGLVADWIDAQGPYTVGTGQLITGSAGSTDVGISTTHSAYRRAIVVQANDRATDLFCVDGYGRVGVGISRQNNPSTYRAGGLPAALNINYAANSATTGAAGGINFGGDIALYRQGPDNLRLDDHFAINVGGSSTQAGTGHFFSTTGIYDQNRAVQGIYVRFYTGNTASPRFQIDNTANANKMVLTWGTGTAQDTNLYRDAADQLATDDALLFQDATSKGYIQMLEQATADPAAPAANGVRIFAKDNGAGKTQLVARFNTGAVQQLAVEP